MINLYSINVNGNYKMDLKLRRPNESVVADIPLHFVEGTDLKFNDTSSLNLKIPRYLARKGEMILNPNYDLYSDKMLISLNNSYMFYIDGSTIKENEKGKKECNKTFTAYSREKIFEKRFFTLKNDTTLSYQIKKDNTDTHDGILDFLEEETYGSWKAGIIDHDALYETVDGVSVRKYRVFENIDTTWLNFLREECYDTYKNLFLFDSFSKTVDAVLEDNIGVYSGICLSFENFVKEINKATTTTIPTRLWVDSGNKSSTVNISEVNPLGTSYIEDYSPYYSIMSTELKLALIEYNAIAQIKHIEFNTIKNDLLTLQTTLSTINNQLTALNEQLKMEEIEVNKSRADTTSTESIYLAQRIDAYNNTKSQIASKETQKNNIQSQIDAKNTLISNIATVLNKKTCTDSEGNLVFTDSMLQELYSLTIEEKYSTDYFDNPEDLYNDAVKHLTELQTVAIEFTTSLINFTQSIKHPSGKDWSQIINLGDFVVIKSDNLGDIGVRLIGLSFKFSSGKNPTIDMTFSNKPKKLKDIKMRSPLYAIQKAKAMLDSYAKTWIGYDSNINFVKSIKNDGIDPSEISISNDTVSIGDNVLIKDSENSNNQVFFGQGVYAVTTDGWQTKTNVISTSGVNAESLTGSIILSDLLNIKNATDKFVIDKTGIHIKDTSGVEKVFIGLSSGVVTYNFYSDNSKKLLSNTGMVQTINFSKERNLDSSLPITWKIYIPDNAFSIYSAKMSVVLEKYLGEISEYSDYNDCINIDSKTLNNAKTQGITDVGNITKTGLSGHETLNVVDNVTETSNHSHDITHKHSYLISPHAHKFNITIPKHRHKILTKFSEGTMASNVTITVNGNVYNTTITSDNIIDLTSLITSSGWKNIVITSETKGRIDANLIVQYFATI